MPLPCWANPGTRLIFNHFDYVNPAAPKGGQITLSALGTFDNFNRYALRGNPGARTEQLYDTVRLPMTKKPGRCTADC